MESQYRKEKEEADLLLEQHRLVSSDALRLGIGLKNNIPFYLLRIFFFAAGLK